MEEYKPGDRVVVTSINDNGGSAFGAPNDVFEILQMVNHGHRGLTRNYFVKVTDGRPRHGMTEFFIRDNHFTLEYKDYDPEQQPYDDGDI